MLSWPIYCVIIIVVIIVIIVMIVIVIVIIIVIIIRVRDEFRLTLHAAETLYESSIAFGNRCIMEESHKRDDFVDDGNAGGVDDEDDHADNDEPSKPQAQWQ